MDDAGESSMLRKETRFILAVAIAVCGLTQGAIACPFCGPAQPTKSEDIAKCDFAVKAAWVKLNVPKGELEGAEPQTVFRVTEKLRQSPPLQNSAKPGREITINLQRDGKPGDPFVLLARTDADGVLQWTIWEVNDDSYQYINQAPGLDDAPEKRLSYFLRFLEYRDPFIGNDAFAEFSQAKYTDVAQLSPKLPREKIRKWLADPDETKQLRHGFYGLLLGLCGNEDDANYLAQRVMAAPVSDKPRLGIAGMMAGYVLLTGDRGLNKLIDGKIRVTQRIDGEVLDLITALKFLWEYAPDRVKRSAVVAAARLLFEDEKFAGTVIIDLARWQDWDSAPRVLAQFGKPPFEDSTGKQQVIRYALTAEKYLSRDKTPRPVLSDVRKFLDRVRHDEPDEVAKVERSMSPSGPSSRTDKPRNPLEGNLDDRPPGAAKSNP